MILVIKAQKFYRLPLLLQALNIQEVPFEQSVFYSLIKEYDNEWFKEIKMNNYSQITAINNDDEKNQKLVIEKNINTTINQGNVKTIDIKEPEILWLIENIDKGEFKITKNLDKFENKNEALIKVFDYIIINKRLEKEHIFQNLWKIMKKENCSRGIQKWLKSNKEHISELINETANKKNILYLISNINQKKNFLFDRLNEQNKTSNTAVISTLNDIEDILLENMSLENYMDVFTVIEDSQQTNQPIFLTNSKVPDEYNN